MQWWSKINSSAFVELILLYIQLA